jgi:Icc-related predicted phosphoesterase
MNTMFISDTYGQHDSIILPRGEMIIHAGDVTKNGTEAEVRDFLQWFSHLDYKYKIFIAGTHDHFFEQEPERVKEMIPSGVIYLEESGVEIEGLNIWGSPMNAFNHGSAFSKSKDEIAEHWEKIPDNSDLVIIRTPAYGVLDENPQGEHLGCKDLLRRLVKVEPLYFVCGYPEGLHGSEYNHGIHFINASLMNEKFEIIYKPVFQMNA